MSTPKPHPFVKPEQPAATPKPSDLPEAKKPFERRDLQPLRNHEGLKALRIQLGGRPRNPVRPRRQK